jgi:hypothetical protein
MNCNTKCSQGVHQGASESGVRFVSGIILKSKALAFERMLFRSTRGNMFFNQAPAGEPVTDPISGEEVCLCHRGLPSLTLLYIILKVLYIFCLVLLLIVIASLGFIFSWAEFPN